MNRTTFRIAVLVISCLLLVMGSAACSGTDAANTAIPNTQSGQVLGMADQIEVHTTPFSIGVRWNLADSNDHNETFSLEYFDDTTSAWLPAAPALHVDPTTKHGIDRIAINQHYWASSLVNLQPDQEYEIRAVYSFNGVSETEIFTAKTKAFIKPVSTRERYAIPKGRGNGQGSGSVLDPYLGLQTAADNALPGDTIHIATGSYQSFQIKVSGTPEQPISWLGPNDGEAIIDGKGTNRGIVTIESSTPEDGIGYNVIQGLTIRNGNWGIDASYSHNIGVFHNKIVDVDYGFFNRRKTHLDHDQQICGNTFIGRTTYPNSDRLRKGVRIKGTNNLTCFNSIANFADCISTDVEGLDTRGSDIVGNDVSLCSDDGIEIDHDNSNMRVWQNRVSNSKSGISTQPLVGGPGYVFRNLIINVNERTIKLHNNLSGLVLVHNTGFRNGTAFSDDSNSTWLNSMVKNNVFWGSFYAFANLNTEGAETREVTHNAFGSSRNDGGNTYWIGEQKYLNLNDVLAAGLLTDNIALNLSDFSKTVVIPTESVVDITMFDLHLNNNAASINSGAVIDHLNSAYVADGSPDRGAFEHATAIPVYGIEGFK